LLSHPEHWWFLIQAKLRRAWTPFLQPTTPPQNRLSMLMSWGPVLVLFLAAFFPTAYSFVVHRHPGSLIHLAIVQFSLMSVIFFGFSRYRYPVEPLCVILAAATVDFLLSRFVIRRAATA
jgi:hypothetical protein